MAKIVRYGVNELKNLEINKDVLIANWLHRGECLFVKAKKKVGKSIFAQNIAHCASSGIKLFGEYDISKPLKVAYLFSEGALVDWKDRVINMDKMYKSNNDNLVFFQCNFLKMYTEEDRNMLIESIDEAGIKPDIIIWDCLYKFLFGKGVNDEIAIGMFNANEEYIRNYYNGSSVIIHHDSEKFFKDNKGNNHDAATVNNAMGHSFILAHPTQIYTLEKHKDQNGLEYNKITLGDKRSGDLVEELLYYNIVPEIDNKGRLGISLDVKEVSNNYTCIMDYIKNNSPCNQRNLRAIICTEYKIDYSRETHRRIINKLIGENLVEKNGNDIVWKQGSNCL